VFPKRIDGQEKDTEKLDSHTISIYETLLYDILEISDFIPREPAAGLDDAAGSESEARNGD
jgi:hypothetical protein